MENRHAPAKMHIKAYERNRIFILEKCSKLGLIDQIRFSLPDKNSGVAIT